ncbi:hypothetical protein BU204_30295 [Actinophytocola xanthii]|uniref:Uncharacterized protein n=2 Tax=Actinophytocola xanthii TaxID=1912961 RepID=A0A1Q8CAG2_9PSEU|nr:hypothetical protein BU204_30295 [Actinophytocola xanthii]
MTEATESARLEAAGELFYEGTFRVGVDVQPGTYAVEQASAGCYWARLDETGETIDNNFVEGASRVEATISASDYSFHNEGCGQWRKVG